MKKIIAILIGLILVCSCCENKSPMQMQKDQTDYYSQRCQNSAKLVELTFYNEYGEKKTHEFVLVNGFDSMNGLTHWPDCKYCKNRF